MTTFVLTIWLACAHAPCPTIQFGGIPSLDECQITGQMGVYRHGLVDRKRKLQFKCETSQ